MECPDAIDGMPCECPGCRQTVMPRRNPLNLEQAETSGGTLSKIINFFMIAGSTAVLAAGGWWGYIHIYQPSQTEKNVQNFQEQFYRLLPSSAGSVQTWQSACMDSERNRFLGDCLISKNGVSEKIRVFGQKQPLGKYIYAFRSIKSADDFSTQTFDSMLAEEKTGWDDFKKQYNEKINAVKSQALQQIKDLEDDLLSSQYYTHVKVKERFIEIRNAALQDPQYKFRLALFGRFRELDNLNKTAAEITAQENNAIDTCMANAAIKIYESQHGSLPESDRVDKYTKRVRSQAEKIAVLCDKYKKICNDIKKVSPDDDVTPVERVDIEELKEKLIPLERNIFDSYNNMLAGIKCGSRRCDQCRDFRFSPEHVKLLYYDRVTVETAEKNHKFRLAEKAKQTEIANRKKEEAQKLDERKKKTVQQAEDIRKAREARKEARRREEERKAAEREARMQRAINSYQSNTTYQVKEKENCGHRKCHACRRYRRCGYHGCYDNSRTKKFLWRGFNKYYYYEDEPDKIYKAD